MTLPILAYADYTRSFKVHTDASEQGLEVVLYKTRMMAPPVL